ncbi:MAG TPA: phosphate acyltransferase PlsX [bacterium]|nr:phosphate acyltransferase PlsX [bacterium]
MTVAVDAMGGDHGPAVIVEGAVLAAREYGTEILLVGNETILRKEMERFGADNLPIRVKHCTEVVQMEETPSIALRKKRDSSIRVAVEAVKEGEAQAVVSAGHTGATLTASTLILRPLKGIDRPAIATFLPTVKGLCVLLDAGANVDCKSTQLFQFGIMGSVFAKYILNRPNPRVGLLGIGEEESKGNEITREAFQMFKQSSMNFIGNVEGKAVYRGVSDVIVCDGFLGNVALKISESLAEMVEKSLRDVFSHNIFSKLGYLLVKRRFAAMKKRMDYSEYGGAPLLGINGVCIICHGGSTPKAIKNAIPMAQRMADTGLSNHIEEDIEADVETHGANHRRGTFWSNIRQSFSFSMERKGKVQPHGSHQE